MVAEYKIGDEVFGLDPLDIVNGVRGDVTAVHKLPDGSPLYSVEFDHKGHYLMKPTMLTNDMDKLRRMFSEKGLE